jgi:hypothetical protein
VWLVNQSDDASPRPNVAAVGAAVDGASSPVTHTSIDPMGTVGPQFLDGTAAPADRPEAIAPVIGAADGRVVATGTAIFRRNVHDGTCLFNGVPVGSRVRVVNVDNARSIRCTTALRPMDEPQRELVMSAASFAEIADPSAAPIDVEIRQ